MPTLRTRLGLPIGGITALSESPSKTADHQEPVDDIDLALDCWPSAIDM